ncbi:hypothetical protein U1Q18_033974 [Sarracenia purpurea var. burkii]
MDHVGMSSSVLKIYIKIPSEKKIIQIQQRSSDSIWIVKLTIKCREGIQKNQQILIYNGLPLDDDHEQLATYNVADESVMYLLVAPPGFLSKPDDDLRISLNMPNWKKKKIDVKSWFTVNDIKAVVESLSGFRSYEIFLGHRGKVLSDETTMEDCDINVESPFYVLIPPYPFSAEKALDADRLCSKGEFQIVLQDSDRLWKESVYVTSSHTVSYIKDKIFLISGVCPNQQILYHGRNTPQLSTGKTLGFYGIKERSVVWLFGPSLKLNIKISHMGTTLQLKVYDHYAIEDIKHMIFEETGIPANGQTLVYNGISLENSLSLKTYNITRNSTIYAIIGVDEDQVQEQYLFISFPLYRLPIWIRVKPWYTILDVKTVIESITEVQICHQSLIHIEDRLEDWKTVSHYGNFMESPGLIMEIQNLPSWIYVDLGDENEKNKGENKNKIKTVSIDGDSSQNLDAIMKLIPREDTENINGQPCLFLDKVSLEGNKNLAQYGIRSGSILSLDRLIQINVIDVHGACTKVDLKPSYSIGKVKTKVEESCGIPSELQMLTYSEDEVDDQMTLGEYEAVLGSLWSLRWNCGGSVWSFFWPSYNGSSNKMDNKNLLKKVIDFHGFGP